MKLYIFLVFVGNERLSLLLLCLTGPASLHHCRTASASATACVSVSANSLLLSQHLCSRPMSQPELLSGIAGNERLKSARCKTLSPASRAPPRRCSDPLANGKIKCAIWSKTWSTRFVCVSPSCVFVCVCLRCVCVSLSSVCVSGGSVW